MAGFKRKGPGKAQGGEETLGGEGKSRERKGSGEGSGRGRYVGFVPVSSIFPQFAASHTRTV